MKKAVLVLTLAIFVLPLAFLTRPAAAADLVTVSDRHDLAAWEIGADGKVSGETADGRAVEAAPPETLLLDIPGSPDLVPSFPLVFLADGEILSGDIRPTDDTASLSVDSALFGETAVPGDAVIEVRYSGIEPASLSPPCVVLSNGDVVTGRITAVREKRVMVESVFGETPIDRQVVGRLVFSEASPPTDGREGDRLLVFVSDGQRVYADSLAAPRGADDAVLTRDGKETAVPKRKIRKVVYPGWRVEYLSRLPFRVTERVPYFDGPVAVEADRNAAGGTLWLGGRWYRHGFGARPRSKIEAPLEGGWAFLGGWVGLDDHLGKMGNASAEVLVDGEVAWASQEVTAGGPPARLAVRLDGARDLVLVTDFGARGNIGDYVNWCEMLLVRKR